MTRRISKTKLLEAIEGTGGIMSTIAARLDVSWSTAYIKVHDDGDIEQAYKDECEQVLDMSEGLVVKTIENEAKKAKNGQRADTSDAKWLLARKGKVRGYGDNVDIMSNGKALKLEIVRASEDSNK